MIHHKPTWTSLIDKLKLFTGLKKLADYLINCFRSFFNSCVKPNLSVSTAIGYFSWTTMRKTKIICTIGPKTSHFETLQQLAKNGMNVTRRIERHMELNPKTSVQPSDNSKHDIARSAPILTNNLKATASLVFTRRGLMAVLLSKYRPNGPIYAFTNTTHVRRRLGIHWGIHPFIINFSKDPEISIGRAVAQLQQKHLIKKGDRVIVLSDILADGKFIETVQVRII